MIQSLEITDIKIITPKRFGDGRGWFTESYNKKWFDENVLAVNFVQDNQSFSREKGTIRGLHFQRPPFAQGKLVRCLTGAIWDIAVDIRKGSPTFGKWAAAVLTAEKGEQLWLPAGFAHGFCTLAADVHIAYKVTAGYSAAHDAGISFADPALEIRWPVSPKQAILSEKDKDLPLLAAIDSPFTYEKTR